MANKIPNLKIQNSDGRISLQSQITLGSLKTTPKLSSSWKLLGDPSRGKEKETK